VKVAPRLSDAHLRILREETLVEDGLALGPMRVDVASHRPKSTWIVVTLDEGKNRQIRRRIEDLGHTVEVLVRLAIGPLELATLAPGAVRPLTAAEVAALARAASPRR
jgi:23S rRNA pseudouridine2605 synthase